MSARMAAPRILVITTTFPPDGAVGGLRTVRLVRHLAEAGFMQDVLTLAPASYRPGAVIDAARASAIPAGVRVLHATALRPFAKLSAAIRRAVPARPVRSETSASTAQSAGVSAGRLATLRRAVGACLTLPDAEASWILPAVACGIRRVRSARPDVIYSSGPPFSAHVVAAVLAKILRRPWVADFRDPWARAPWREDRFAFEKRAWAVLERLIVERAAGVVFVTQANRDDFAAAYGPSLAARFHVVPNGCDLSDFRDLVPRPPAGRFVLLHAGSLYGARDPSALFRAVARGVATGVIDRRTFRVRLIGRVGLPALQLPQLLRELALEEVVEMVPHMPRGQVLQEMVDASALLVVQPITKLSVPGKLYEYLAAGRPILALAEPDGETAAVLRRTRAGVVAPPSDEDGILHALGGMINRAGLARISSDPGLYDGAARARELAATLRVIASGRLERTEPANEVAAVTSKRS